jgi:hypothetical protein
MKESRFSMKYTMVIIRKKYFMEMQCITFTTYHSRMSLLLLERRNNPQLSKEYPYIVFLQTML